jgi:hypothetical protein
MTTLVLFTAFVGVFVLGAWGGVALLLHSLARGPGFSPITVERVKEALERGGHL